MAIRGSIAMLCAYILLNGNAGAAPVNHDGNASIPAAGALSEGEFTPPPKAFFTFCAKFAQQCVRFGLDSRVVLDRRRWSELKLVNGRVNERIQPKPDPVGRDVWTLGAKAGDCDEYAIEKRKELMDLGWPSSALRLTVVRVGSGEAHLVLTVRTEDGEFVLDNLKSAVLAVEAVGYRFVMRQSAIHPRLWVSIDRVMFPLATVKTAKTEISAIGSMVVPK